MGSSKGKNTPIPLELLAPAANKEIAMQAVLHGADAVYMGGPSHGARHKASNSIEDIRETVEFAHRFRARVYVTVNTIVYESELKQVEQLCHDLYRAGVDALIVQDMALLRLDLPPIALHASTQCDTRTAEKARFLQDVGFSQIVLARELSIDEIRRIARTVTVPVECFVHGALCVSYSGRCGASCMTLGRSANRGECAQMCRLPYTLRNGRGEVVEKEKYLLSLRDFNASASLAEMIEAGARSFKIEGRLKDDDYVRNVTAYYREAIDRIIDANPARYCRSSFGRSEFSFRPNLAKSFNRGFTEYFLHGRQRVSMASLQTPKSMGEVIDDVRCLNNGDGISFFNEQGEYEGVRVNRVDGSRIIGARPFRLPKGAKIHRTSDIVWQQVLSKPSAVRKVWVDVEIDQTGVTARDERGCQVRLPLDAEISEARKPMDIRPIFAKTGNTIYELREFRNSLPADAFIPASQLTALRRRLLEALDAANVTTYPYELRREEKPVAYPATRLDARDNVANSVARQFYADHGVTEIEPALELRGKEKGSREGRGVESGKRVEDKGKADVTVMTTRYCLRRELGVCLKDKSVSASRRNRFAGPLTIQSGPHTFRLDFDCARCEMNVTLI